MHCIPVGDLRGFGSNTSWSFPSASTYTISHLHCVSVEVKTKLLPQQTADVAVSRPCSSAPQLKEEETFPTCSTCHSFLPVLPLSGLDPLLLSGLEENCHFTRMAWFSVSTPAVAQWQVRYGWGGFRGHRAMPLHKSPAEVLRTREEDAAETHQHIASQSGALFHHIQEKKGQLTLNEISVLKGRRGVALQPPSLT